MARAKVVKNRPVTGQVDDNTHMSDSFVRVRHIGAKKFIEKVVEEEGFIHNQSVCPMCGQKVPMSMGVRYCNDCMKGSKAHTDRTVESRREKDRWVMREVIDVKRMEEKMSERAERFEVTDAP